MTLIIFVAGLLFVGIGVMMYITAICNGLIGLSRNIDKAWANIDVLLKQRHDEIPKLIKVCEGHMKYERAALEKIAAARAACISAKTTGESSKAEEDLSKALKTLFALAEDYPDLKADQNFMQLRKRVNPPESRIADRRELFNDSVNNYNIRIHRIPDMWVAGMLHMKNKELFK